MKSNKASHLTPIRLRLRVLVVADVRQENEMQGMLNMSSFALLVGAFGQQWFYGRFPLPMPQWLILGTLFLPWVVVYVISFCNAAPFGPRPYRLTLIGAMCWFGTLTVGAEIGQHVWHLPPEGHIPLAAARCLMYLGYLSFIPFILAIMSIRKLEKEGPPNQALHATSEPAPGAASSSHEG